MRGPDSPAAPCVAVEPCGEYEAGALTAAVRGVLAALGGARSIFPAARRIAVKVNLLTAARPDRAVTTHPAVARAVCAELRSAGLEPFIVDSPGAGTPFTEAGLRRVYETCGYAATFAGSGIELNTNTGAGSVAIDGRRVKRLDIVDAVRQADGVVSLAKGKTHGFTQLTGATKNLFGVIPGAYKAAYHAKLRKLEHFAEMLVDVATHVRPALSIIDAVVCMEGNGPSAGTPRQVGCLLGSTCPCAADKVLGDIIGLPLSQNPVVACAAARGCFQPERTTVQGVLPVVRDFRLPDTAVTQDGFVKPSLPFRLIRPLFKHLTLQPAISEYCVGCGVCAKSCPVQAIRIADGKAIIDYSKCIRCYCCHEMCPHQAVCFRQSRLHRLLRAMLKHL